MESKETSDSKNPKIMNKIEKKLNYLLVKTWLSLLIIAITAFVVRLYFTPFQIPLTLDALEYFWYANDISILGHLPSWVLNNNGWPTFLSLFFSISHFNNFLEYMILQRIITISISVLSIIPVYLLCNRFFDKPYALVGTAMFLFDPRIIQNSLLGITDPLYILLTTSAIFLFISNKKKLIYASFGITALTTIVRAEGIFLFFIFSIIYLVQHKKERYAIAKYAIALAIFIIVIIPMITLRIETTGGDSLTERLIGEGKNVISASESNTGNNVISHPYNIANPIKFLGWSMIPIFIFFAPIGAILILRNRNQKTISLIAIIIALTIPSFYALLRFSDTRYLFPLYPLFCILSLFTIKRITEKITNRNTFLVLLIIAILLVSIIFIIFKNTDINHEKEALSLARYVDNMTSGINPYMPESKYLSIVEISKQKFPIQSTMIATGPKIIPIGKSKSIQDYITYGKEHGLTNLVLDGSNNNPEFLNEVFSHEEKYPYLEKIFDSWNMGYKYHIKIYKINYEKFEIFYKI